MDRPNHGALQHCFGNVHHFAFMKCHIQMDHASNHQAFSSLQLSVPWHLGPGSLSLWCLFSSYKHFLMNSKPVCAMQKDNRGLISLEFHAGEMHGMKGRFVINGRW